MSAARLYARKPPIEGAFIVKVQLPVTTTSAALPVMVYNETRTVQQLFPLTDDLLERMTIDERFGPELKMFFWAVIDENKMLHLDEFAPWQEW